MEERNFIVYKHTSPSNKVYIGITNQKVNRRFRKGKGYSNNKHFFNAIEKYGWDNFQHEILFENFTKEEAKLMEQCYIALYNSYDSDKGYNNSLGGEGTYGFKPSSKTRKKLSEIHKKNWEDPKYREKMKERNKKMWENPERKEKQKEASKKMWENPEYRKNMSIKSKERWGNPEYQEKMKKANEIAKMKRSKKVICLTTNKVFESIKDAGEFYNIKNSSHIGACCKDKRKYCGKLKNGEVLKWMLYDEYLKLSDDDKLNIFKYVKKPYKQIPWNRKKVILLNNNKIFNSTIEGAKFIGIKAEGKISECCKGKRKSAGKINGEPARWMYYEDYLKLNKEVK